jgi:5-methylcytosine-specific restriction endonuclease McrA
MSFRGRLLPEESALFFNSALWKPAGQINSFSGPTKMKTQKPDAELVWKQFTDFFIPEYKLSITDRAVYWHLFRHSRLEGKRRLHFSIAWLARGSGLTATPARESVRRLASHGIFRMLERSRKGHIVEVRLPSEVRAVAKPSAPRPTVVSEIPLGCNSRSFRDPSDLDRIDFLKSAANRRTIHDRDGGRCFYCLRRLNRRTRCLDHVIPRAKSGRNSYRNLVSACVECNSIKSGTHAHDLLRRLYREHRLTYAELADRIRALKSLAAGKLRPVLQAPDRLT